MNIEIELFDPKLKLVDWEIEQLCANGLVAPFDRELINPASLDIRIGTTVKRERKPSIWQRIREGKKLAQQWQEIDINQSIYYMEPKEAVLVDSLELFNFPDTITGVFQLKSSRGRELYNNVLAGYCDPGWNGSKLTMELVNESRYYHKPLYPGMRIGQIHFQPCLKPNRSYSKVGRYNGDRSVQESKG